MDRLDALLQEERGHQGLVDLPAIGGPVVDEGADRHAVHELELYIDNTHQLYKDKWENFFSSLTRKVAAGKYDRKRALKMMGYLVDRAAKEYAKEFGGTWNQIFSVPTRKAVAASQVEEFEDVVKDSPEDLAKWVPKKYAKNKLKI